ncbi:MAG: hypothetical protein ACREPL_08340 [Rhodanobacteraceae bacterium]
MYCIENLMNVPPAADRRLAPDKPRNPRLPEAATTRTGSRLESGIILAAIAREW